MVDNPVQLIEQFGEDKIKVQNQALGNAGFVLYCNWKYK